MEAIREERLDMYKSFAEMASILFPKRRETKDFCNICKEYVCSYYLKSHNKTKKHQNNLIRLSPVDEEIKTIDLITKERMKNYENKPDDVNSCRKCLSVNIPDKKYNKNLGICITCDRICRGGYKKCCICKEQIDIRLFERPTLKNCKGCVKKKHDNNKNTV